MDCLQPAISRQLALLVNSITAERRQAVLEIARSSRSWHDFLDALQRGGFPLPESLRCTRVGTAGTQQALITRQLAS